MTNAVTPCKHCGADGIVRLCRCLELPLTHNDYHYRISYNYTIHKYVGTVEEIRSVVIAGYTVEETIMELHRAVEGIISSAYKNAAGGLLPRPYTESHDV